jgi:tRNA G37 N-methylase Trm5
MTEIPALHPHAVRYAERNVARNSVQKILVVVDPAPAFVSPVLEE